MLSLENFALAFTGRGGIEGDYRGSVVPLDKSFVKSDRQRLIQLEAVVVAIDEAIASLDAKLSIAKANNLGRPEPHSLVARAAADGAAIEIIRRLIATVESRPCAIKTPGQPG